MSTPTVKEIKDQLTDLGIEFDSSMKKADLLDLLEEAQNPEKPKSYVVLHDWKDLEDNGYVYFKGDPYPRKGNKDVSDDRILELSTVYNKRGKPLIKERD